MSSSLSDLKNFDCITIQRPRNRRWLPFL